MPTDHTTTTTDALRHLGITNRDDARQLLGSYARRHEMTANDIAQVLDDFPARRAVTRDTH
ncbi:hypothetical protein F8271_06540 [Micromonospora sp. ALFpr18c]|uniref:hypothetical protein n=1 Tax=Micromonospora sp. ALFpr18c TaxID=1458665 RepID=UPI00124B9314|nr:hypothetical protein [Micromonospora sp. ALFpr18c]KAB1946491.1 hypothetical protein F8271_06540 [Micromonospora sp. ALFpr18c]